MNEVKALSQDIKKHRNDALASGVIIGYGIGLFTNVAVLLTLKETLTKFEFFFPEESFNEITTIITVMGILSFAIGMAYEIYKRRKL